MLPAGLLAGLLAAATGPGPVCDAALLSLGAAPALAFRRLPGWTALAGPGGELFTAGVPTIVAVLAMPLTTRFAPPGAPGTSPGG